MISVEERLAADGATTQPELEAADWSEIVGRADRRTRRKQATLRIAIVAFLSLIGAALILSGTTGLETAEGPMELTPPTGDDVSALPQAPPSLLPHVVPVASWTVSFLLAVIVFFTSPRSFRAPFFDDRVSRLVATLCWVCAWNLVVAAITGVGLIAGTSESLASAHFHAGIIVVITAWGIALGSSVTKGWHLIALFLLAPPLRQVATPTQRQLEEGVSASFLAWHLLVATAIAALAWYGYKRLRFRPELSRFRPHSLSRHTVRQFIAAVFIVGGVMGATASIAPNLVLASQLGDGELPQIDLWQATTRIEGSSALTSATPRVQGAYLSTEGFGVQEVDNLLLTFGEAANISEPLMPGPPVSFELWEEQTNTDLTIKLHDGFLRDFEISPTDRGPFERNIDRRNLFIAAASLGILLLWSESAVTRFTVGPNPWERNPQAVETLGWVLFGGSGLGIAVIAVMPLVSPISTAANFVLVVAALLFVACLGARLIVPRPPKDAAG